MSGSPLTRVPTESARLTQQEISIILSELNSPVDGGTRLTLEHRGWDSLPPDHPARHGMNDSLFLLTNARWWEDHFAALRGVADE